MRLMEEEHPMEAMVIDEVSSATVEQVPPTPVVCGPS